MSSAYAELDSTRQEKGLAAAETEVAHSEIISAPTERGSATAEIVYAHAKIPFAHSKKVSATAEIPSAHAEVNTYKEQSIIMAGGLDDMTVTERLAFTNALIATVSGDLPSYAPTTAAEMTAMGTARDKLADSILDSDQKREASRASIVTRNIDDKFLLGLVRAFRDRIKAHGVADDKYSALGFPTGPSGESITSATVPIATVDTSKRLQHTINFADAASPNIKRRPKGVKGCQIWFKIDGPLPAPRSTATS